MIYFDYAANTPTNKDVLDAFLQTTLQYFANPNSTHYLGKQAKDLLDLSTLHICDLLNIKTDEIIYTSGASESNNLVMKGIAQRYKNKGRHILVGSLEHNSLLAAATHLSQSEHFEIDVIPLNKDGQIDLEELEDLIQDDTILVSVCAVDSELGIVQPIHEIAKIIARHPQCLFHVDASQAIGKIDLPMNDIHLMTLTPHKFYGMNGFGALIKRHGIHLIPQIHGGKSTTIYRSGTPDLAQVVAFDKALTIALKHKQSDFDYIDHLSNQIKNKLSTYSDVVINNTRYSLPHYINFSFKSLKSDDLVEKLEQHDIIVSAKTSCCPENTPSKLVLALTHDKALASSSVRLCLSHLSTQEEVNTFLEVFDEIYKELKNGKI